MTITKTEDPSTGLSMALETSAQLELEAAVDAAKRSRFAFMVVIFASVLALSSFWTSRSGAWNQLRVQEAARLLHTISGDSPKAAKERANLYNCYTDYSEQRANSLYSEKEFLCCDLNQHASLI